MSTQPTALPPKGAADVLYLIDFSGYVFRAYHAMPPLEGPTGEPTHATYGTVAMLQRLIEERKPAYLGVAMDTPGPRKRSEIDARYKAHRPPPPEDLMVQMRRSREFVEAYRIPIFIAEGHEADDLVAAAVEKAREKGLRVVIASSDKDLMQLVDDTHVMLWDAMRDKVYGAPEVTAKFGVPPSQLRDLLALVGDTSDNVPGVPGIGPKTAAELLAQFGTLDALYQRLDEVKKPKTRESLKTHEADARISKELVTLRTDGDVTIDLEALRYDRPDDERLRALFSELGFTRFLKALPAPRRSPSSSPSPTRPSSIAQRSTPSSRAPSRTVASRCPSSAPRPSPCARTSRASAWRARRGTPRICRWATATSAHRSSSALTRCAPRSARSLELKRSPRSATTSSTPRSPSRVTGWRSRARPWTPCSRATCSIRRRRTPSKRWPSAMAA
ncbi:DNA polymerase I [Minicystis rosea]|nr:DNA polymerase I [Minicystis rosea]